MSHVPIDSAEDWIERLGLRPLAFEGGFYRETYRSSERVDASALRREYGGPRSLCTSIYYLLTPTTCSRLHRLRTDEIYHFYRGDPVVMVHLHDDGSSRVIRFGGEEEAEPQILVPAGIWQGSILAEGGRFALMGTTMSPGFDLADFEAGDRDTLLARYPDRSEWIVRLTEERPE